MAYVAGGGRRNGGCECVEIVVSWWRDGTGQVGSLNMREERSIELEGGR